MKAKSIHGKSVADIRETLNQTIDGGFKPTLAIIFMSIKHDRNAICKLMDSKNIDVFGATSCGEFINDLQTEGEIVMMLLDLSKEHYKILFENLRGRNLGETASNLASTASNQFSNPSLILCSTGMTVEGEYFDGETFVKSINESIDPDRVYFGGMAGDDWTFSGSYLFTNHGETDFGMAALVLDADKVSLTGMAISGWKPMGISRRVTKSKGNLLYTIDGKPAVEMYYRYLGQAQKLGDESFDMFKDLSIPYPFIVKKSSGETTLRSPLGINNTEHAIEMGTEMPEGTEFWFTVPPDFDISEEITERARELKDKNGTDADALLIFSCAGRPPVLGPLVTVENEGLAEVWNAPMAGFFTYGEYGRAPGGKQEYHSCTCCWVALKEN
ncbi:FIST signal transduction protein [Salinimicrobium soli]|uniref:FIST signal transduction protein n=1 Tax=Salinimicrobium soli TaxID=1254399 RepID=UPI003AB0B5FD